MEVRGVTGAAGVLMSIIGMRLILSRGMDLNRRQIIIIYHILLQLEIDMTVILDQFILY